MNGITFYQRFEMDILSQKKTITIRDASEKDFVPHSIVDVSTYEDGRWFCQLRIVSVTPISFSELTDVHAQQENMTLEELKQVISDIYPETPDLYVIAFELVK